jgi:plasmid stabilization system protein ParE
MKYTVVWTRFAEGELASIWINSSRRNEVSRAAERIDRLLRRNPQNQGESRIHETRILLVPPLGVSFGISTEDRRVEVLDVWEFRSKPTHS